MVDDTCASGHTKDLSLAEREAKDVFVWSVAGSI